MAFVVIDTPSFILTLKHVERKRDGSFQYRRRIPADLQSHFSGKKFFVRSLGKCCASIQDKATALSTRIDRDWSALRGNIATTADCCAEVITQTPAIDQHQRVNWVTNLPAVSAMNLSSALALYLKLHAKGNDKKFREDNERVMKVLIARIGDLNLNSITRAHAEEFRDHASLSQSTGTIRRKLHSLTAIINRACKEKQIQILNPFEGLGIVGEGEDGIKRIPFDNKELWIIAGACRNLNDDIRHIIALQLDTGCRVAEIVGLRVEDVIVDHAVPHVRIRPWGKVRTLKTAASERDIPLVGTALWASEKALAVRRGAKDTSSWLFPRYAVDTEIKATHASATLNKWLRTLEGVNSDKTTHCFRHAMRDRLRAAQVPHDIQEAIGGWGTRTIGQGYGNGYPIAVLAEHMSKISSSTPNRCIDVS